MMFKDTPSTEQNSLENRRKPLQIKPMIKRTLRPQCKMVTALIGNAYNTAIQVGNNKNKPGRWHNGSAFVFCPGDCFFESEPSPTSAHTCGEVTGCMPAAKRSACVLPEVDLRECTLNSPLQKANKTEPTLALKPRGDVTRNPKQGCQWPQKRTCVPKNFFKKRNKNKFNLQQKLTEVCDHIYQ